MMRRGRVTRIQPRLVPELARLRAVERVALEFCARCESGEIRSVATYRRFRDALAGRDLGAPPPSRCCDPSRTVRQE